MFNQTFIYDNANRLSSAEEQNSTDTTNGNNVQTDWTRGFNYDAYGNMWVTNPTGITPPGNTPSSSSNYDSNNHFTTVNYDAAGNQLLFNGNQITYDAGNRQTAVYAGSAVYGTYGYDGNGNRILRTTGSGTTVYVYDAFNQLAAEYSNSETVSPCQTCYLHRDHLGTVRLITDASGTAVGRHDYLPFGEEIPNNFPSGIKGRGDSTWAAPDNINQKFTGKERDSESMLDYFGARYYGSALGRFTSPDPANAGADPNDPQSWNMYSYVNNNPLSFVDPTGLNCIYVGSGDVNNAQNYVDDNSGGQSCSQAFSSQENGKPSATVHAQQGSLLDYLLTISTHEIPRYDPNDVPINSNANTILHKAADNTAGFPDVCSGGAFVYAGVQGTRNGKHGGFGYFGNYDQNAGWTNSGFGEVSTKGSPGVGGAYGPTAGGEGLAFIPVAEFGGAMFGFSGSGVNVGGYLGTPEELDEKPIPVSAGVGAYINISTVRACAHR